MVESILINDTENHIRGDNLLGTTNNHGWKLSATRSTNNPHFSEGNRFLSLIHLPGVQINVSMSPWKITITNWMVCIKWVLV